MNGSEKKPAGWWPTVSGSAGSAVGVADTARSTSTPAMVAVGERVPSAATNSSAATSMVTTSAMPASA